MIVENTRWLIAIAFVSPATGQLQPPAPLLGVWERINIGVFIAWVVVLAIALLRRGHTRACHAALHPAAHPA